MFIVAELSCNHEGRFNRAMQLIDAAAQSGADAIKLQTWTPGKMASKHTIESGPWAGRNLQSLYDEAQTPWGWHKPLFDYAKKRGMIGFSTPFDLGALEFLESINCPMYKIASFEIVDLELIKACAKTGKPLIISTGMATQEEIIAAVDVVMTIAGMGADLTLLKCTSAYPAPFEDCNLKTMEAMSKYAAKVGLSDHTKGIAVPIAATVMGADVIEKHLTLSRKEGLDAEFSLEPSEFKQMVTECRNAEKSIGVVHYGPTRSEGPSFALRRSLHFSKDIHTGEVLTADHVTTARPGTGEHPAMLFTLIGRTMLETAEAGTPIKKEMLVRA